VFSEDSSQNKGLTVVNYDSLDADSELII
jgi:hypothetical protein